ncbi:PREDICTED: uncharacterized protein LOC107068546 isoform X2 [Polistes dominula]|uniref:Uncharacterized protein LOC107068546 isoform X2 n=1 Tax=Polistes dominula TaxID=743375 RepID=A0ABM1IK14_POLDO|nr:PREDICTED: uncharacterized protein LOC107068546 isoform X2 [Polistes dominula]
MKWKRESTEFLSEKTFLIIRDNLDNCEAPEKTKNKKSKKSNSNSSSNSSRDRSTDEESDGSQARLPLGNTSTWPPKIKRSHCQQIYEEIERPKTANLDKPSILNPELVDKLDMSLLSKELLSDSMTRYHQQQQQQQQVTKTISGGNSSIVIFPSNRPRQTVLLGFQQQQHQHLRPAWNDRIALHQKRRSFEQILNVKITQIETIPEPTKMQKNSRIANQENCHLGKKLSLDVKKFDNNNNNRNNANGPIKVQTLSSLKKKNSRTNMSADVEVFTSLTSKNVPEPCRTCGRSDQPERFHSHPKDGRPGKTKIAITSVSPKSSKVSVPKTIQKPMPLNFRSDKNRTNKLEEALTVRDVQSTKNNPEESSNKSTRASSAPIRKGPKTVTCYICGREFGTAGFPIHEPKCMEKWERENNSLPVSQRRARPKRPEVAINHSEWNAVAWKESQTQLVPCSKCGRTFLPERLSIHSNSCKASPKNLDKEKTEKIDILEKSSTISTRSGPPMVPCQICARNFSTRSIKIHEPQCMKRWKMEKENKAANSQRISSHKEKSDPTGNIQDNTSDNPIGDTTQKRMITCYICGRDFGSVSIAIHEPQCLKKWHLENNKLSPKQRRKEPQKPDIIYTNPSTGDAVVDIAAMAEASWKTHLNQLVPCKNCGRTFNPDRVTIHEKSCKGNR